MAAGLKKWRDSATLILVAKQAFRPSKLVAFNNYKVLTMKRSAKSSFMPETHVFPGGSIDKADCSQDWLKLYNKFGINETLFKSFNEVKYISPIFANDNNIPRYISLRICAIRETFEECGVLLCKSRKSENKGEQTSWASYLDDINLEEWQKRVHNDPKKFIELCDTFHIYPDIWALHEWSNWLTPSGMGRRFDTMFFIAAVQSIPRTLAEENEVQHIEWAIPKDLLEKNAKNTIFLPPPQYYELLRLMNFQNIEDLAAYCPKRALHGTERFLPYRLALENAEVTILPGDELYPGEKEAQIPNENVLEEISQSEVMHRIFHPDPFNNELILHNYTPFIKHVLPVIEFARHNSKL